MQKIDFVNSQQPAINDTNLNLMQQYIENAIQGAVAGDTLPVGSIMPFGGETVPDNYLLCDGQAVSRTTYAQLFSVIGTSYGVGDGSTTFNLPDLRGRVPVGYDSTQTEFNSTGKTGGEKTHTLTVAEMPAHQHKMPIDSYVDTDAQTNSQRGGHVSSGTAGVQYNTTSAGGGQPHNILQPYITQKYIIKAFQAAGTVAQIVNTHDISSTDAYSASYINGLHTYSTTEKRIGTWIDGKPIYRKVFDINNPSFSGDTLNYNHGIANMDWLVDAKAIGIRSGSGKTFQRFSRLGTVQSMDDVQRYGLDLGDIKASGQVQFIKGNLQNLSRIILILEYTKTTD